jgi:MPBQ/MSBQ methyltransferase
VLVDVEDLVRSHYGGADLEEVILSGLRAAGVDTDALTLEDLAAVDQLHAGFLPATHYLLAQLELSPQTRLLDLGCGIGGPARVAAASYACPVVGVDLSPDFIRVARFFTERLGLNGLVEHRVAAGDRIDVADASFDRAMIVHVGMNIPDKAAVFAEVRRALRPGGTFALFEQMKRSDDPPNYPLPWAEDERSSFVAAPEEYVRLLEAAGFTVTRNEDRTAATAGPGGGSRPALSPAAVFGPDFVERIQNNIAATRAGILAPVLMLAVAS